MKFVRLASLIAVVATTLLVTGSAFADGGFDDCGYNETANIYVGTADCVDDVVDGAVWGDPTYANDHLVMKWSDNWPDEGSHIDNHWNGKKNGSGEVWQYRIDQSNECAGGGTLDDGGYCIWGSYEVIQSHGTVDNEHIWDANSQPNGYGVDR